MGTCFRTALYREAGLRHRKKGKPCEDSVYEAADEKTGVTAIALCDGAGSYANAGAGAERTSCAAAELLAQRFNLLYELDDETCAQFILNAVLAPLKQLAQSNGWELMSLSATLLCVAMHPDGRYLYFHVGDGVIGAFRRDGRSVLLSQYKHQFAANVTTFVTVKNTEYRIGRGTGDWDAFVLMSDGPEDLLTMQDQLVPRVDLLFMMSFFLQKEDMESQLWALTGLLKSHRMDDDASFAVIADRRRTGYIFKMLTPELKTAILGLSPEAAKASGRMNNMVRILSVHPNGISLRQFVRESHVHKERVARKRLQKLRDIGLIQYKNGLYIL